MDKKEIELLYKIYEEQQRTNQLLQQLLHEIQNVANILSTTQQTVSPAQLTELFDPELLLSFSGRMQTVIKEIAKYFQRGHDKLVVEDLQKLLNISYPQAAHYLSELEERGLLKARRGDKKKGENPLKKYYYLPSRAQ